MSLGGDDLWCAEAGGGNTCFVWAAGTGGGGDRGRLESGLGD